jgi:hypothetical protein
VRQFQMAMGVDETRHQIAIKMLDAGYIMGCSVVDCENFALFVKDQYVVFQNRTGNGVNTLGGNLAHFVYGFGGENKLSW